jgi:hypothetical protein
MSGPETGSFVAKLPPWFPGPDGGVNDVPQPTLPMRNKANTPEATLGGFFQFAVPHMLGLLVPPH